MLRLPRFVFLSWIVQECLNLLSQEELCSIFLDQNIWVPLNLSWLFLLILIKSQFVSEGYTEWIFFGWKTSCIIKANGFNIFSFSSLANILISFTWIVTELCFSRTLSNVDTLSFQIVLSASDLYHYQVFYYSTLIPGDSMPNEI